MEPINNRNRCTPHHLKGPFMTRTHQLPTRPFIIGAAAAAMLLSLPNLAHAHGDHSGAAGLVHGMAHPVTGIDHILAMVGVGLLAAKTGGRARWMLPLCFVLAMALGGTMGMAHVPFLFVEHGILASILILGVAIAAAGRLPLRASAPLVAFFALFHGYAHGLEAPANVSGITFGVGFALATLALHGAGIGMGLALSRSTPLDVRPLAFRLAGLAIVVAGVVQAMM